MFLHLYKNRLYTLIKNKTLLFWSLVFPIALGTLFYFAFGHVDEKQAYQTIPVAVVTEAGNDNPVLLEMLNTMESGDKKMFLVTECTETEAKQKLSQGEVSGIILVAEKLELLVQNSGMNQTILRSLLNQYSHMEKLYMDAFTVNPSTVEEIQTLVEEDAKLMKEVSIGGETVNQAMQYFYSLIAMACLYGCFLGLTVAEDVLADLSALAARRRVAPTHHMIQVLADMMAAFTAQFISVLLVVAYLQFILRIDFIVQPALFFTVCLFGSISGVCIGQFIGSIAKKSTSLRVALSLSTTMLMSMFSGLMFSNMKYSIDQHAPIINRLNPAALITEGFYCLTVYSDYERFVKNMVGLAFITGILLVACFFTARQVKYNAMS